MSEIGEGFPHKEPVRTADQLVTALKSDPPEIFQGTTAPLVDMRGNREDIYFTLDAINRQFVNLIGNSTDTPLVRGRATHFGQSYPTVTRDLMRDVLLARSIIYDIYDIVPNDEFHPFHTLGLYTMDPEGLKSTGIELTNYRKMQNGETEELSVYNVLQGAELGGLITESSFDINRRTFAESQIFVGAPYMTDEEAYQYAKKFGLTQ